MDGDVTGGYGGSENPKEELPRDRNARHMAWICSLGQALRDGIGKDWEGEGSGQMRAIYRSRTGGQ